MSFLINVEIESGKHVQQVPDEMPSIANEQVVGGCEDASHGYFVGLPRLQWCVFSYIFMLVL